MEIFKLTVFLPRILSVHFGDVHPYHSDVSGPGSDRIHGDWIILDQWVISPT